MIHVNILVQGCLLVTAGVQLLLAQEPQKCCVPDQFVIVKTSIVGIAGQEPLALNETQEIAFDYNYDRIGALVTRSYFNGQPQETFRIVEYIHDEHLWVIFEDKKQCSKSAIEDFPFRCIPANATFSGTFYAANKRVYADTWSFYVKDYLNTTGWYTLSVVPKDGCVPFTDTFVGSSTAAGINQQMVATSTYSNFEPGIRNPDRYFQLPEYCP